MPKFEGAMSARNVAMPYPRNKLGGSQRARVWFVAITGVVLAAAPCAHADMVTDSNAKAAEIASRIPSTPIAVRTMAIVQVSVFEAANAITGLGTMPSIRWRPGLRIARATLAGVAPRT